MKRNSLDPDSSVVLREDHLDILIQLLRGMGYLTVGPTHKDGAIVYDEISSISDLPKGWTEEQEAGSYRLAKRDDNALFCYTVGPHSWKKYLLPSRQLIFRASRDGLENSAAEDVPAKYAFLGVRACDLAAIAIQDKVLAGGPYIDQKYAEARRNCLIIAVNCTQTSGTCFCASMRTGPQATSGFDIALTEVIEHDDHYFLAEIGTQRGDELLGKAGLLDSHASKAQITSATKRVQYAAEHMGRSLDTQDLKEILYQNTEHPRYEEVAARCLNCANCTLVCPTCFCFSVEDTTDLTGTSAQRSKRWDSCFTLDFSYIHGGSVRPTAKSRYRQWLTHKLASWQDQFGTSGCVGCGRCITWCPVGIDITEEASEIREQIKHNEVVDGDA